MNPLKRVKGFINGYRFGKLWSDAKEACNRKQWAKAAERLEQAHNLAVSTDESRYLLGSVYRKLGRFEECLHELDQIVNALEDEECEAQRHYCYSVALFRLGQFSACRDSLILIDDAFLSEEDRREMQQVRMLAERGLESPGREVPIH